jgi:hypothetical protein
VAFPEDWWLEEGSAAKEDGDTEQLWVVESVGPYVSLYPVS